MSKLLVNIHLRIWHPIERADVIAEKLGMTPRFAHNVGDNRKTPAGNLLEGAYDSSYASIPLVGKVEVELDEELMHLCDVLGKHADLLRDLRETGGKLEFYVSVFLMGLGGFELDRSSLRRIHDLGFGFAVELYPKESENH